MSIQDDPAGLISCDPYVQLASLSHGFEGVLEEVQEQLFQLGFVDCDERSIVIESETNRGVTLLQLATQQLEGVRDRLPDIHRACLLLRSAGDASQACDKIVDAVNLPDDDLGEVFTEVNIGEAFRKKLGKGSDRDKRVLDFVSDTGCERTERGKPFGPLLFVLEFLKAG